jgi:hypothetical protein
MSLDFNYSKVDRDKWPDPGAPLYDFCMMMMITGVSHLKTDEDLALLTNRAIVMSSLKDFGWKHYNKKDNQMDLVDWIPLMKGLTTNVSKYSTREFLLRLKGMGVTL